MKQIGSASNFVGEERRVSNENVRTCIHQQSESRAFDKENENEIASIMINYIAGYFNANNDFQNNITNIFNHVTLYDIESSLGLYNLEVLLRDIQSNFKNTLYQMINISSHYDTSINMRIIDRVFEGVLGMFNDLETSLYFQSYDSFTGEVKSIYDRILFYMFYMIEFSLCSFIDDFSDMDIFHAYAIFPEIFNSIDPFDEMRVFLKRDLLTSLVPSQYFRLLFAKADDKSNNLFMEDISDGYLCTPDRWPFFNFLYHTSFFAFAQNRSNYNNNNLLIFSNSVSNVISIRRNLYFGYCKMRDYTWDKLFGSSSRGTEQAINEYILREFIPFLQKYSDKDFEYNKVFNIYADFIQKLTNGISIDDIGDFPLVVNDKLISFYSVSGLKFFLDIKLMNSSCYILMNSKIYLLVSTTFGISPDEEHFLGSVQKRFKRNNEQTQF